MSSAAMVTQTYRVKEIEESIPAKRRREAIGDMAGPATSDASGPGVEIKALSNTSVEMSMMRCGLDSGVSTNIARHMPESWRVGFLSIHNTEI